MNHATITGRLTADPELRRIPNGSDICQLRLAVESMGRNHEVGYVDVISYGLGASAVARVLTKGWLVAVHGRLEWRTWEKDGARRQAHRIVGTIEFLAAPKVATSPSPDRASPPETKASSSDSSITI